MWDWGVAVQIGKSKNLNLAVTHLNAPVGSVLTVAQLANALRAGSVGAINELSAAALVGYLFVELDPQLIVLCAYEAGTDAAHAHRMYQEGRLLHAMPQVPNWENAIEYLL